ncbi:MAG: hypothetical protein N2Z79_04105 [Candidatus Omnitrophica bacterium]|nr:hypothetical protein [Candidatus Omnitrophota bacterium]
MKRSSSIFVLLFFLSGCATITPPLLEKPIEREKIFSVNYDRLWEAGISVFIKSSGILSTIDKQSGVMAIVNTLNSQDLKDFVIERPPSFPWGCYFGNGQVYINAIFSKVDENSTRLYLKTKILANLFNAYGYPLQFNVPLTSNGKLEEEIFKKLSAELGLVQYDYLR